MCKEMSVLLVGDVVEDSCCALERPIFDEDNPSKSEVASLVSWITEAGYEVDVCDNVCKFIESGPSAKDVLVFPLWRGGASRNRTAIVPAYCEERGIPFVGGDASTQAVCQDKSISKMLANAVGIRTPQEVVLHSPKELKSFDSLYNLKTPFVVKPLLSACSIGVHESSLCNNIEQGRRQAEYLLRSGLGPVLFEEFIAGEEISICIIEENGSILQKCVGGYRDDNGRCPFHKRLHTFEDKMNISPPWTISALSETLVEGLLKPAEELIRRLGKVDVMRIDGRINDGLFYLIELTPDIHLSLESMFLGSFNAVGCPPPQLLDNIIRSSLRTYNFN
jgi:D-alanine-D-alanine ligase